MGASKCEAEQSGRGRGNGKGKETILDIDLGVVAAGAGCGDGLIDGRADAHGWHGDAIVQVLAEVEHHAWLLAVLHHDVKRVNCEQLVAVAAAQRAHVLVVGEPSGDSSVMRANRASVSEDGVARQWTWVHRDAVQDTLPNRVTTGTGRRIGGRPGVEGAEPGRSVSVGM